MAAKNANMIFKTKFTFCLELQSHDRYAAIQDIIRPNMLPIIEPALDDPNPSFCACAWPFIREYTRSCKPIIGITSIIFIYF